MSYPVLIRNDNGDFRATVLGLPEFEVRAPTRDAALDMLQRHLKALVDSRELVEIDVDAPKTRTPLEQFGIFKDDPTWGPMCDEIERQRDADVR